MEQIYTALPPMNGWHAVLSVAVSRPREPNSGPTYYEYVRRRSAHVAATICLPIIVDVPGYSAGMSAERDELRRLVEDLSDDRVPARRQAQPQPQPTSDWPPLWFASFSAAATIWEATT